MSSAFDSAASFLGGYHQLDGTVEFFGRVQAVTRDGDVVLDLGAGRAAWYHEDPCATRRGVRDLRKRVREVVGADIDPAVMENPTTSRNVLIRDGRIPLADQSVDVVVAEYVFEHVEDVRTFVAELDRVLKPGGFVCARTPHRWEYVSLAARLVRNAQHFSLIKLAQPGRQERDTFPTFYRLNTLRQLRRAFPSYGHHSYLYSSEPTYYFGSRTVFRLLSWFHRVAPRVLVSNLFVFLQKPSDDATVPKGSS